jgi:hypothetical protein
MSLGLVRLVSQPGVAVYSIVEDSDVYGLCMWHCSDSPGLNFFMKIDNVQACCLSRPLWMVYMSDCPDSSVTSGIEVFL